MRESWDRLEEKHEVELARCRKRVGELEQLEKERSELELQRKAEIESLRENLQKYLIVADFAYDWEYWLGPDRKCLYISLSVERITGYSTDDFICNPDLFEQIVHPDDRHAVAGHLDECLRESSKQCAGLEFRVITKEIGRAHV
jgi:PAS domain-containing protein